jgi:hypothetical protein
MCLIFIPWDVYFNAQGIWGFKDERILGIRLMGLPIEEYLFFLCIPYACLFWYECSHYFFPQAINWKILRIAAILLCFGALILAFVNVQRWYTLTSSLGCALLLCWHIWIKKSQFIHQVVLAWLVLLVPFYVSNGVLTGLDFWKYPAINFHPEKINSMVVWYNNSHNIGLRIWTVPFEDFYYGLMMFLSVVTVYERFGLETRALPAPHGDRSTPQEA